jgi:hypothetical protein
MIKDWIKRNLKSIVKTSKVYFLNVIFYERNLFKESTIRIISRQMEMYFVKLVYHCLELMGLFNIRIIENVVGLEHFKSKISGVWNLGNFTCNERTRMGKTNKMKIASDDTVFCTA